ncbi:MAG TPA: SBBP repeat-containing protein [Verrucomicrobiae bacterium]|nr:SBBP repeat-containing protein [Verrucomicrobiae bacterium]
MRRIFILLGLGAALPHVLAQSAPDLLWARRAGGNDSDTGHSIAIDLSGNVYVAGAFYAMNDFGAVKLTSAGLSDIFIAKYDPDGNFLWARRAGGTGYDEARGIAVDASGNAYVTGLFQLTANFAPTNLVSAGQSDVFLAKYDPAGNLQWARRAGGNDFEESHAIRIDSSTNIYIAGYFDANANFGSSALHNNSGSSDIFIAKADPNGNFLWARQAGGNGEDIGDAIALDAAANVYVTGYFETNAVFETTTLVAAGTTGLRDMFLASYTSAGNFRWVRQAGGVGEDAGSAVAADDQGNVYVTGSFTTPATFTSTNLTGSGVDMFLAKYSSTGAFAWARRAGGNNAIYGDGGEGVALDGARNVYVTGFFSGTANFGTTNLATTGLDDIFLAKYNPAGTLQWARKLGGTDLDVAYAMAIDAATNICLSGSFYATATFGSTTFTSFGLDDSIVVRFGTAPRPYLAAAKSGTNINLSWPNWATNFWLESADQISNAMNWVQIPVATNAIKLPIPGRQKFFRLRKP